MKIKSFTAPALSVAVASLLVSGIAVSSNSDLECTDAPQSEWMSEEEITAKAEELGYEVRKVKADDGCYEVYAKRDGERYEVYFHPITGEVVEEERDD